MLRLSILLVPVFVLFFTNAIAADLKNGKKLFGRCKACHSIEEGGKNKIGPNLWGVLGSVAGTNNSDYKYSKALIQFGEEGGKWDNETMTTWLKNPKKVIKKTKMIFPGLKKDTDLIDIIAYLESYE